MSNKYEGKFIKTPAPAQLTEAKKPKKIPLRRRVTRFRRAVKKNRYYQIALGILICLLCFGCGHYHADRLERPYVEQFYEEVEDLQSIFTRWKKYSDTQELDWWLPKARDFYMGMGIEE